MTQDLFRAEAPAYETIRYSREGQVATVAFNRASRYNAYSTEGLCELADAVRQAAWDDRVACIVLTGTGEKAFCTGGDVKEYAARYVARPRDYWKYMGLFRRAIEAILRAGKPTIARINGMAVGGGNEMQAACDLAIIAEHAYLKQVGTSVGSVACGGATQWLPLLCGDRRAREILFLNEPISARKALEWGLVNEVVPSVARNGNLLDAPSAEVVEKALRGQDGYAIDLGPLDEAVARWASKLEDRFPECMRYTREQLNYHKEAVWNATVGHAADWLALHFACWEPLEGMSAFVEKRAPDIREIRRRAASDGSSELPWGPYTKACTHCGAKGLPASFSHCGECGQMMGVGE